MAETTDFLDWIAEKHQMASSQDIGQVTLPLALFQSLSLFSLSLLISLSIRETLKWRLVVMVPD